MRVEIIDTGQAKDVAGIVCLGNLTVNDEMVRQGWAWARREYLKDFQVPGPANLERQARNRQIGLWQQFHPMPPWEFRKVKR